MTEAEWLTSRKPMPMLRRASRRQSARKGRLVALGCCRQAWELFDDPRSRAVVDLAELFEVGGVEPDELRRAVEAAADARAAAQSMLGSVQADGGAGRDGHGWMAAYSAAAGAHVAWSAASSGHYGGLVCHLRDGLCFRLFSRDEGSSDVLRARMNQLFTGICNVIRDIVGNPFRPVAFDPGWRTSAVVALAETVYADRAWDRLPVLADALEDAGCTNADVLGHLRGPGPHARGCWVVDLLLGKT